jgi:surface protein
MYGMFNYCSSLTSLDVSNFNTEKVTDMGYMFSICSSLTSLDLSSFNTENVTSMGYMFTSCSRLTTIYVGSNWSTANVTSSLYMFISCFSLKGGQGTTYDENHIDQAYAHIDAADNPGYFTAKGAFLLGDVNGDGDVNVADVTALVNIVNNVQIENGQWIIENADVDGSGEVTSDDVPALVNKILGK